MTMTYVEAIGAGFPGVECHSLGDGSVYETIVWDAGLPLPSKQTLDEWIASNGTQQSTRLTVLAFRNRFTQSEKVAIEMASLDNPSAPLEQRQLAAMLRVYTADVQSALYIDVQSATTREGVLMLEQYGIIGTGRALQILDVPPLLGELSPVVDVV